MKTKRFGQPHITIALFLAVLFGLGAAFLLLPDRGFSAHENRYLAQAPKVTAETILSGDMTRDAENYINDQFPLRDRWIVCQAALSRAAGRRDNNGVYFGKDHTLIETFWTYDKECKNTHKKRPQPAGKSTLCRCRMHRRSTGTCCCRSLRISRRQR